MKIMVTGAAGFIGAHVAKYLAEAGNEIFCLDNFSNYYSIDFKKARIENLLSPIGIKVENIAQVAQAGADTFVAGSAIFGKENYTQVIEQMRTELGKTGKS